MPTRGAGHCHELRMARDVARKLVAVGDLGGGQDVEVMHRGFLVSWRLPRLPYDFKCS